MSNLRCCPETATRRPCPGNANLTSTWRASRRSPRPGAMPVRPARGRHHRQPLQNVAHLLGSGGVLRHAVGDGAEVVLRAVLTDHGGGWRPPEDASASVDTAYLLFAAGLLAPERPEVAARVAEQVLSQPVPAG